VVTVKLALVGVGDVAQRDYLPEFRRLGDRATIVAACGKGPDRVRDVAEEYGIPATYTDLRYMLEEEEDVDAVINLTPIQTHAEVTAACLEAGKHVYTEKPIASTVAEALSLGELARSRDLILVCAPSVALFPQVVRARGLLEGGEIGEVYSARGQGLMGVPPWPGFLSDPTGYFAEGAGPAFDMGVYPLHILTTLLGPVERVMAMLGQAVDEFFVEEGPHAGMRVPVEVPDNWHLLLDFGQDRIATVTTNSCVQASRGPLVELYGLRGTIGLHPFDVGEPVALYRPGVGWKDHVLPANGRAQGPDHHLGVEHLVECVQSGRDPVLSFEHALHAVEVLEKAVRSSREGRMLTIDHRF
jgi:predicted dehydrogenase